MTAALNRRTQRALLRGYITQLNSLEISPELELITFSLSPKETATLLRQIALEIYNLGGPYVAIPKVVDDKLAGLLFPAVTSALANMGPQVHHISMIAAGSGVVTARSPALRARVTTRFAGAGSVLASAIKLP